MTDLRAAELERRASTGDQGHVNDYVHYMARSGQLQSVRLGYLLAASPHVFHQLGQDMLTYSIFSFLHKIRDRLALQGVIDATVKRIMHTQGTEAQIGLEVWGADVQLWVDERELPMHGPQTLCVSVETEELAPRMVYPDGEIPRVRFYVNEDCMETSEDGDMYRC